MNRCVYYHLISKECILIDLLPPPVKENEEVPNNATNLTTNSTSDSGNRRLGNDDLSWQVVGQCGWTYD